MNNLFKMVTIIQIIYNYREIKVLMIYSTLFVLSLFQIRKMFSEMLKKKWMHLNLEGDGNTVCNVSCAIISLRHIFRGDMFDMNYYLLPTGG